MKKTGEKGKFDNKNPVYYTWTLQNKTKKHTHKHGDTHTHVQTIKTKKWKKIT